MNVTFEMILIKELKIKYSYKSARGCLFTHQTQTMRPNCGCIFLETAVFLYFSYAFKERANCRWPCLESGQFHVETKQKKKEHTVNESICGEMIPFPVNFGEFYASAA